MAGEDHAITKILTRKRTIKKKKVGTRKRIFRTSIVCVFYFSCVYQAERDFGSNKELIESFQICSLLKSTVLVEDLEGKTSKLCFIKF